ncbi:MAG: nucleotidyltransferase domain-containing protein [Nanoarchaeota archaeon]
MNRKIIEIRKKITPVLKKYNIAKAGVFGSYARGEQKKKKRC